VGSYPIAVAVGSLTAASYSFSLVNGTLTVNRAGLTVTANNLSINYGAAIPALTYTMKGLVNGDTQASATTGAPALTTTAIANSPAGSYPITVAAGTLAAANYSFGYVPGELAIWSLPSSLPSGVVNAAYSATLSAVGGQTPLTWSIASGSLPAGLSLNGSAGLISGTPSAAGTSAVTLQVQDTNGNLDSVALALTVVPQSPVIGSMAPASGPPGTLVTLFGTQFGSSNSPGSSLTVSGAAPPNMQWTNTVIMFQVPPTLPAGAASVLVTTSLGSSSSWTFTVLAPPTSQDTPCN
jgi:hypothetical protein